jgi:hypothetical protein
MAFDSSSSSVVPAVPLQPISEKLTWANFPVWKALVMSALRGAQLHQFLDGKVEFPLKALTLEHKKTKNLNPDYVRMVAKEKQVLNYLMSSLSHGILLQAVAFSTPTVVWGYITSMFECQSRACVINVRMALSTTKKGYMTTSRYVAKMKALTDEMASVGKRLDDEDLVSYILAGLDMDFDSVISAISTRVEPVSVVELYGQLLSHEQGLEL